MFMLSSVQHFGHAIYSQIWEMF